MKQKRRRIPVVLQMEALECGAASLAMVLASYGRYIPLEKLRVQCGVSRDGSNAKNILVAARYHGMVAKGYRYSAEQLKKSEVFPAIIHWNFNHFVVLAGFKKNKAIIYDPASGRVEVDMETFQKSYTGISLVIQPGEKFEPCGKPKSALKFFSNHIAGYKIAIGIVICLGLTVSVAGMAMPVFTKIFTDYILLGKSFEWMQMMLFAMLSVLLFLVVVKIFSAYIIHKAKGKMMIELSTQFLWHTLHLPIEFFLQRSSGDISGRQADNEDVTVVLFEKAVPLGISAVLALLYFGVLLYYSVPMSIIALTILITDIIMVKIMSKKTSDDSKNVMRDQGKYMGIAMSGISMIETIKSAGAETGYFQKIVGYQTKYNNSITKLHSRNVWTAILPEIMTELCNAIILIMGVYYILEGTFTIGMLLAFQGFFQSFVLPINELMSASEELQKMSGKMDRIEDVMLYQSEESSINPAAEIERLKGEVSLEHVTFGYSPLGKPLIQDFSIQIKPGEMVAFVGGSGSGKSTIANLITGLYSVWDGKILFDGKQRKELDSYVFRESLRAVDQNIFIFRDTVRNNLTLWDDQVDMQTLIQACKDACIYEDIMNHPEGFDYVLDEGGKNLSGGQRQRLEIARAFIANPSILILDEATSALDPITEKKVMLAVKARKITCIIVAHRLSTIRDSNQIVVLQNGREVERGTHETLIENEDGVYAKLVRSI